MSHAFVVIIYRYTSSLNGAFFNSVANWTGRVKDLTFSSKNPGGFSQCTFRLDMPWPEAFDVYSNYHHYFISVEGGGGEIAWQGRLERPTVEPGQVTITAYGLWANAFDDFYNDGSLIPVLHAEHSILNFTDYAPFDQWRQQYAQSFTPAYERAVQDIQINLANFGIEQGAIYVELREGSKDGTIIGSNSIQVANLTATGLSEFIGVPTDSVLDPATEYWIVIRPDSDCLNAATVSSGTHTGSSSLSYLVDSTKCWLSIGVPVGITLTNSTQAYMATVSGSGLADLTQPIIPNVWWREASPATWHNMYVLRDGNTGTEYTITNFDHGADYIYVGDTTPYGGLRWWVGSTPQSSPAQVAISYLKDGQWIALEGIVDGTDLNGATLGQNGDMRFPKPDDWSYMRLPDRSSTKGYWLKITFGSPVSTSFTLAEFQVGDNSRLNFSDLGVNDWDNGDTYVLSKTVGIARDSAGGFTGGVLQKYDGSSWGNFGDAIFYVWAHPKYFYTIGDDVYTSTIVEDVISECIFIDDALFKDDDGIVVNPIRFTREEKHGNVIEKVVAFGSSGATAEPLFFGVYDKGIAHLRKFNDGTVWYVDAKNMPIGQQALSLTSDLDGMKTHISVLYSDESGARMIEPWSVNQDLYDYFGYTRAGLYNISGANDAIVDIVGNVVSDVYKLPSQKMQVMIEGTVRDAGGAFWPCWMVRAGDIVVLRNILPSGAVYSDELEERITRIYVQETNYDADNARLTITPTDLTMGLLDIILAMADLSGGSMR